MSPLRCTVAAAVMIVASSSPVLAAQHSSVGVASWYGPGFQHRLTANGEVFRREKLTAASPSLPLPCIVKVTNLKNGRWLVVRVNDRGPYSSGRVLDVSERVASLLGFHDQGLAKVRIEVLKG
jgi:rare lipoprotein A